MGLDPSGSPYEVLSTYLDSGDSLAELQKASKMEEKKRKEKLFWKFDSKICSFRRKISEWKWKFVIYFCWQKRNACELEQGNRKSEVSRYYTSLLIGRMVFSVVWFFIYLVLGFLFIRSSGFGRRTMSLARSQWKQY